MKNCEKNIKTCVKKSSNGKTYQHAIWSADKGLTENGIRFQHGISKLALLPIETSCLQFHQVINDRYLFSSMPQDLRKSNITEAFHLHSSSRNTNILVGAFTDCILMNGKRLSLARFSQKNKMFIMRWLRRPYEINFPCGSKNLLFPHFSLCSQKVSQESFFLFSHSLCQFL